MLIFSGRQAASRRGLLQEMRNKEASASSTPGACGVGAPGQLATHFVRCARFLLRLIQIGLAATERTTCRAGGADFRTATPANGRAWRVRRDYIVLDATATPAAAAEAGSVPAPKAAMPSAGPRADAAAAAGSRRPKVPPASLLKEKELRLMQLPFPSSTKIGSRWLGSWLHPCRLPLASLQR